MVTAGPGEGRKSGGGCCHNKHAARASWYIYALCTRSPLPVVVVGGGGVALNIMTVSVAVIRPFAFVPRAAHINAIKAERAKARARARDPSKCPLANIIIVYARRPGAIATRDERGITK